MNVSSGKGGAEEERERCRLRLDLRSLLGRNQEESAPGLFYDRDRGEKKGRGDKP